MADILSRVPKHQSEEWYPTDLSFGNEHHTPLKISCGTRTGAAKPEERIVTELSATVGFSQVNYGCMM